MSKFRICPVATGFTFHLHAENGQPIAASEVYFTRSGCLKGIEAVRRCAQANRMVDLTEDAPLPANPRMEVYQDKRGAFRFRLRARNGKIIAISEGYASKSACLAGLESVIANAISTENE